MLCDLINSKFGSVSVVISAASFGSSVSVLMGHCILDKKFSYNLFGFDWESEQHPKIRNLSNTRRLRNL